MVHDGTVHVAIRGGLNTSHGFLVLRASVSDDLTSRSSWYPSNDGSHLPDLVRQGPHKSSTLNHVYRAFDVGGTRGGAYSSQGETLEAIFVELDEQPERTPCNCSAPQLLMLARVNTVSVGTRRLGAGLACNLAAQYLVSSSIAPPEEETPLKRPNTIEPFRGVNRGVNRDVIGIVGGDGDVRQQRRQSTGAKVKFLGLAAMPGWGITHNFIVKDKQSGLYWMAANVARQTTRNLSKTTFHVPKTRSHCQIDRGALGLYYSPNMVDFILAGFIEVRGTQIFFICAFFFVTVNLKRNHASRWRAARGCITGPTQTCSWMAKTCSS